MDSTSPTKISMEAWQDRDGRLKAYPLGDLLTTTSLEIDKILKIDVHLYNQLEAKEVLTPEEVEFLQGNMSESQWNQISENEKVVLVAKQSKATNPERVRDLLYILRRRSLWHYRGFLDCLEDSLNGHVIGTLPVYDDLFTDAVPSSRRTESPRVAVPSETLKETNSVTTQTDTVPSSRRTESPRVAVPSETLKDTNSVTTQFEETLLDLFKGCSEIDKFDILHAYFDRRMRSQEFEAKHAQMLNTVVYTDMSPSQLEEVLTSKYINIERCKFLMERLLQTLYDKLYSEPNFGPVPTELSIVLVSGAVAGGLPLWSAMASRLTPSGHLGQFTPLTRDPETHVKTVGSSCVGYLGFIFLFGGKPTLRGVTLSKSWIYSPVRNTWTPLPDMSTPRMYFSVHVLPSGRYILAVGGSWGEEISLSSCERFDLVTRTWSERAPMPTARFAHAGAVCDGRLYVTGGHIPGGHTNGVCVYDEGCNSWTHVNPMLEARMDHQAGAVEGRVVVCGGWIVTGEVDANVLSVEMFSVTSQQWTWLYRMGVGRLDTQAVTLDGYMYVVGGARLNDDGQDTILNEVARVDMKTGEVVQQSFLPFGVQETAVCLVKLPKIGSFHVKSPKRNLNPTPFDFAETWYM